MSETYSFRLQDINHQNYLHYYSLSQRSLSEFILPSLGFGKRVLLEKGSCLEILENSRDSSSEKTLCIMTHVFRSRVSEFFLFELQVGGQIIMQSPRITFHHFIFRELIFAFFLHHGFQQKACPKKFWGILHRLGEITTIFS